MNVGRLDILFIFGGIASMPMMADTPNKSEPLITFSSGPQVMILTLIGSLIASFIVFASAIDRKCTEDYLYQIISNASLVGVATALLINMVWLLGSSIWGLPELSGQNMAGITLFGFIIGYFWFRFRGIAS